MGGYGVDEQDLAYLESLGVTPEQLRRQLQIFERNSASLIIERPCRLGDGIERLEEHDLHNCLASYQAAADQGRFSKFVPASGAATRMFQCLYAARQRPEAELRSLLEAGDADSNGDHGDFVRFLTERKRFAFFEAWQAICCDRGRPLETLLETSGYHEAVDGLLNGHGLGYGSLPKAMIPFHRYEDGCRTALEEHLVEAAAYVRDGQGVCRIHFTVGAENERRCREFVKLARSTYERRLGCVYEVGFSVQKPATNTLAVDLENRPLRDDCGRLLLRPSGHGALLVNLIEIQGDLVYIKNIDNVVPDHLKTVTTLWKKALGGLLIQVQDQAHELFRSLGEGITERLANAARHFLDQRFQVRLAPGFTEKPASEQRRVLLDRLNRPIRVCGMVPNVGEPGGGPFWVRGRDGELSLQIVEKVQVCFDDPSQASTWQEATHFNPVDLVCGVRDASGKCFDLERFRDPEAVFIARKSRRGKELKALELPGLWNGAMAHWNTIFVEVPRLTFNPVKTVNDLLRPEHQPQGVERPEQRLVWK